jgi:ribonuclease BN (tRNA processing enzyme)
VKLVPLGINGFVPTFGRHTTSFLLLTGDSAILLDAGTGLARLFESDIAEMLSRYAELNIILSHYHLDHIIGLSYLPGIRHDMPVSIYAPARPLVESNPDDSLRTMLRPPFFSMPLDKFPMPIRVISITNSQFQIGKMSVSVRAQTHPGGSIGIRLADVVFMTDTIVDDAAIPFMRGAKLLLHEVWLGEDDIKENEKDLLAHSDSAGVVKIALAAEIRQMMPIHIHPKRTPRESEALAERMNRAGLEVKLPAEGRVYEIPSAF